MDAAIKVGVVVFVGGMALGLVAWLLLMAREGLRRSSRAVASQEAEKAIAGATKRRLEEVPEVAPTYTKQEVTDALRELRDVGRTPR